MLVLENIGVEFDGFSLHDISLSVAQGDYLTILGVSGAGKTVLLEILAGLVKPTTGRVLHHGTDITRKKIQARKIVLVYQDQCLFPHMTVAKNIAYPMRHVMHPTKNMDDSVHKLAAKTDVLHLLGRYPQTLSGGEAQRVALARALAADPDILLLDEPLANLDVKLRSGMRSLLRSINRMGKTMIHVTHDYMEAATLSKNVAIVDQGRLIQTGTPKDVFRHPRSQFVAHFSGVRNIFPCTIQADEGQGGLNKAKVEGLGVIYFMADEEPGDGYIMIGQQDIILSDAFLDTSALNQYQGTVKDAYPAGNAMELIIDAGVDFVVHVSHASCEKLALNPGRAVCLTFKASAARFLPG